MMSKEVEAYFCGWCFPAHPSNQDPDRASVEIKYADGLWEEIARIRLRKDEGCSDRTERAMARVVLEHFLGCPVNESKVQKLIDMPGTSIHRLTPDDLESFRQADLF